MMLQQNFPYGHVSGGNLHNRNSLSFLEVCYRADAKDLVEKVSKSIKTDLTQQIAFYNSLRGNKAEAMDFERSNTGNLLITMDKIKAMYAPVSAEEFGLKQLNVK